MTVENRIRTKLERMAYYAFVEVQTLTKTEGTVERIRTLAETAELIPEFLSRGQDVDLEMLLNGFDRYGKTYGGQATRYLQIWNMTDEHFDSIYGQTSWQWPEPAAVPA